MIGHDIEALKRRGRLLAREKGIGRQKALDLIAVEEGHRHWGDLLSSMVRDPIQVAPAAVETPANEERDWALDHLDRMSGARTGTFDEFALSAIGTASGRIFGTGVIGAGLASTCVTLLITLLYQASKIGNPLATFHIEDVVEPMINLPLSFAVAALCWYSPHSVRFRRIRYTIMAWCSCMSIFATLSSLARMKDAVFATGPSPFEAALSPINLMGPVIAAMWIGTHAGRRRRN